MIRPMADSDRVATDDDGNTTYTVACDLCPDVVAEFWFTAHGIDVPLCATCATRYPACAPNACPVCGIAGE